MSCKLKKNTWDPNYPLFLLYFKDCVKLPMFDFGISCHLLRLMGICRIRVFEKFRSPFSFLPFLFVFFSFLFFFLFFIFSLLFLSLSRGPFIFSLLFLSLSRGPLDIVHPCHPVATPLNKVHKNKNLKIDR